MKIAVRLKSKMAAQMSKHNAYHMMGMSWMLTTVTSYYFYYYCFHFVMFASVGCSIDQTPREGIYLNFFIWEVDLIEYSRS